MTKAPCEAALMCERHVRIEISDFVMRTFVRKFADQTISEAPATELLFIDKLSLFSLL